MSSNGPESQAHNEMISLRAQFLYELLAFADDSYPKREACITRLARRLQLHELEDVVNELDAAWQDEGPSGVGYIY